MDKHFMDKLKTLLKSSRRRLVVMFTAIFIISLFLLWFVVGVPEFYLGQIMAGVIAALFSAVGLLMLLKSYLNEKNEEVHN